MRLDEASSASNTLYKNQAQTCAETDCVKMSENCFGAYFGVHNGQINW